MSFGINGAELIILIMLAVLVLGPEKLPEYTRKLTEWIRNLRRMAEGAKDQFRDETGTDFDEIDWRRYDPRQYDPRRIIREALADPVDDPGTGRADTRETLRKDLDSVRSERDTLREDLKDMDPRALFFGSSSARRDPSSTTGTGPTDTAPTGTGSSAAGTPGAAEIAVPAPDSADESAGTTDSLDAPAESGPAPFDAEAT